MATEAVTLELKVDTSDIRKATSALDLLREQEAKLDKQNQKLPAGQRKVIDQLHRMEAQAKLTTDEFELYKLALQGANQQQLENASLMQRQARASGQATKGFGLMKGGAANLSMQLQDVAVQMQSGTAASIILAQQGPQIASAFGPAGAAFGAVIAFGSLLAGPLLASMFDAGDGADELDDIMKELGQTFKRTGAAAFELSEDLLLLTKTNADLASIEIAAGMAKAEKAITLAGDAMAAAFDEISPDKMRATAEQLQALARGAEDTDSAFDGLSPKAIGRVRAEVAAVAEEINVSEAAAAQLLFRFKEYENDRTPENLARLQQTVSLMSTSFALADEEFLAFATTILESGKAIEASEALLAKLNRALTGAGVATELGSQKADDYLQKLQHQADIIGKTAGEVAFLEAKQAGLNDEQAAEAQRLAELIELRKEGMSLREEGAKAAEREALAATQAAEAIALSLMTEEDALKASYDKRRDIILTATFETEEERQALLTQLQAKYEQEREEITRGAFEKYLADTQESLANFDTQLVGLVQNLTTGIGGALESAVFDAESLDEAFAGLAETIGRSAVNALGQFIAEYAITQLLQKTLDKANQTGAAAMMTANAGAMAAQAVLNAYASTAAIPIVGPTLAPAAAAAAGAFAGPLAATVSSLAAAGAAARALGGQVRAGQSYLVGERGPELLTMGNAGGRIMTNEKLRNQGGAQINYAPTVNISGGATEQDRMIFASELKRQKAEIADMLARRRF